MYEIKASPIEELDLLIRYLGKSSSRQVSSIKTSNPGNLKLGLEKAWTRIDTIYGSPEKIDIIVQCRELLHVPHLMTSLQSFATCFPLTNLKQ
jgi:hypothetical protein